MIKNLKNKKGITLIALIVTIVIMLILASVTIKIAKDGGLFDYAKKAKKETENVIAYEQELINEIYNLADDNVNDTSGGNEEGPKPQEEIISFKLEMINYNAKNEMTWGEWIESEYNTINAYKNNNEIYITNSGNEYYLIRRNANEKVFETDKILKNTYYSWINDRFNPIDYFNKIECKVQSELYEGDLLTIISESIFQDKILEELANSDNLVNFWNQDVKSKIESYFADTANLNIFDVCTLFTEDYEDAYRLR